MSQEEIAALAAKLADEKCGPYNEHDYTDHSGHNAYRSAYEEGLRDGLLYAYNILQNE